ncbi:Putative aminopeptidase ysdC [Acholeplasma hippikon]|uniref:Aminopeptidase ysdC n=1 Tax=Acholeplasma hippikon TaxID=264636 RepID=A0A449BJ86_9MOLU|nr:Putative aminopeptidase ysdC [Acholeplasma hippikon]
MSLVNLLKDLTTLNGIPSNEKEVSTYIQSKLTGEYVKDNLGSVIYKKGKGPKVLISAHMDEIGLIVTKITKEGFIKFQTVGGFTSLNMLHQQWTISTKNGPIRAISATRPLLTMSPDQKSKAVSVTDLYLDAGFTSDEEALKAGVHVGAMVTPYTEFQVLNQNRVLAKALDNRAGVAVVMELFEKINKLSNEFYAAFTVQEEVGIKGAKTSAYMVEPDIAIAVDCGAGFDVPGGDKEGNELGKGPQIYVYDAGLIAHHGLRNFVIEIARKNNIPFQESYMTFGNTDASQMHVAKNGAASLFIGIPARNIHSHTSIVDLRDLENTVKLLTKVLEALNEKSVNEILY